LPILAMLVSCLLWIPGNNSSRYALLLRSRLLLDKFSDSDLHLFHERPDERERVFHVTSPVNMRNDRVYVPRNAKKRQIAAEWLLRCRPTFSKSLMVSIAVSMLGCLELFLLNLA